MNYYLFIPFGIIILFLLPIKMTARISFNFLDKSGSLGIFFYKFKLEDSLFWIRKKKIVSMKNNKAHAKEIEVDSDQMLFAEIFISQIKNKTHLRQISVIYNLGLEDAFLTSMVGGYLNSAIVVAFTKIKCYKPTAHMGLCNILSYNKKVCQFAVHGILSISLFDVVYSLARTVILTRKKLSEKRRLKNENL